MRNMLLVTLMLILTVSAYAKEPGRDHPLFPRIKNYYIESYFKTTGKHVCVIKNGNTVKIDGLETMFFYKNNNVQENEASKVMVYYEKLIRSMGGEILWQESNEHMNAISGVIHKEKNDIWVIAAKDKGALLELRIVEAPRQNR